VAVCPGPSARHGRCPLLEGGSCPLVEGADVIVVSLRPGDDHMDELVRVHERRVPEVPLVLEGAGAADHPGHRTLAIAADECTAVAALRAAAATDGAGAS
jgi:hypothetical protein